MFALTGLTLNPSSQTTVRVYVYRPSGSQIGSFTSCYTSYNPGCSISLLNLSQTGVYTVVVCTLGRVIEVVSETTVEAAN